MTARAAVRVLDALSARDDRGFAVESAVLMAARVDALRRLARLPRAFQVRVATLADTDLLTSFTKRISRAAKLMNSGDVGLVAVADGRIQAMEWLRPGPAEYDWD